MARPMERPSRPQVIAHRAQQAIRRMRRSAKSANFVLMESFKERLRKGIVSRAQRESSREQKKKTENFALFAIWAGQG